MNRHVWTLLISCTCNFMTSGTCGNVGENGWKALLDSPHAQHFRQHCSLCNRWIKDPTALSRHLLQTHGDLCGTSSPQSSRLSVLRLSTNSPETVHAPGAKGPRIVDTIISAMSFSKAHSEACSMADNVTDVFGSWLPALAAQQGQQKTTGAKQPRENSSADGLPSKRAKPTRRGGRGRGQSLCLQEDALNRIRLETSPTLHPAQQGREPCSRRCMMPAPQAEQRKKSVQALRVVVFGLLLAETQARMQLFFKDDAAVKAAQTNQFWTRTRGSSTRNGTHRPANW